MNKTEQLFDQITNKIMEQLKAGVRPWERPWVSGASSGLPLRFNGVPYTGMNVLWLWIRSVEEGFSSPFWMTFKQAKELGGSVMKGSQSTAVFFGSTYTKTELDEDGNEQKRNIPFLKTYRVFNASQISGLPESFYPSKDEGLDEPKIENAEQFFTECKANIVHGGDRACFVPSLDVIRMPEYESFNSAEGYYATLGHEMIHWTGHHSRLDRLQPGTRFGDESYAFEELVAEIGSAFLCGMLGITPTFREDHASYIGSWLTALGNDNRLIMKAASKAQKAVGFLQSLGSDSSLLQAA